jgi:hypothetical protein
MMTSSIFFFLMETPYFFFLDPDSHFNCLNDSIKILLSHIRKFLRKKRVGKNYVMKVSFFTHLLH